MNKKGLVYFIFFLLLALNVVAQGDFTITTKANVELCPCSNQGYPVYIQNKEASTTAYSISFAGSAAKWAKAVPSEFSINPGATSYFFVYVNSDCNLEDSYELFVNIKSGELKTIKQNLSFTECYKFEVEEGNLIKIEENQTSALFSGHTGAYNVCGNEETTLPLLITNKESYSNSYILSLRGIDWAELSAGRVSLEGDKKGIVMINLKPGEGSEGEYNLEFNAVTKLGNVKESKEIEVIVDECYGLNIEIKKEEDVVCGEGEYDVAIENDGKFPEKINLSTNFDWAILNETLILAGYEEVVSKLILEPGDISGSFDVELKGEVLGEDVEASDTIKIEAVTKEDCYRVEIDTNKKITNQYTEEYYNVDVVNKGLKKAVYYISLDGPEWADISPDLLELAPGQKGNLNLHINPKGAEADSYELVLKLESGDADYSETIDIKLAEENKIIRNIKWFINYFQFYIYLAIALIFLVIILIRPIKKQVSKMKKSRERRKLKREKQNQREEERKKKEEEKEKSEEERKKQEEEKKELKEKKIKEEKKTEKSAKKKKYFGKKWIWVVILIIIGALVFLSVYFKLIDYGIFKNILPFVMGSLKGAWAYSYYIFIALVFLALIVYFFRSLEKGGKEKERKEKKNAEKKNGKKKIKFSKVIKSVFKVLLIIIVLGVIGTAVYYLYKYIRDFFILYWNYMVVGIVVLILVILVMKFYKPVVKLLRRKKR